MKINIKGDAAISTAFVNEFISIGCLYLVYILALEDEPLGERGISLVFEKIPISMTYYNPTHENCLVYRQISHVIPISNPSSFRV